MPDEKDTDTSEQPGGSDSQTDTHITGADRTNQPHSNESTPGSRSNPQHSQDWRSRPEWWLVIMNTLLFLAAVGSIIVFYKQLMIMDATLGEVKSGSKDTHELAVAAKNMAETGIKQAEAIGKLAQAAQDQVTVMKNLSERTLTQAQATARLGKIAEEQTKLTKFIERAEIAVGTPTTIISKSGKTVIVIPTVNRGKIAATRLYARVKKPNEPTHESKYRRLSSGTNWTLQLEVKEIEPAVVLGRINYDDGVGGRPYTPFCFVQDKTLMGEGWTTCKDQDIESQDIAEDKP